MMKNPLLIIGPMPEEIAALKTLMLVEQEIQSAGMLYYQGMLFGEEVLLVQSGVGKVFAAMITQHAIDRFRPAAIILTGVAGALNTAYEIGDLVIGKDMIQHDMNCEELGFLRGQIPFTDMRIFKSHDLLFRSAASFPASKHKVHVGRILSGDQFLSQKELEDYAYVCHDLQGDIVEMEAAAVAQVCQVNGGLPFLCVKTISDKADGEAAVDFANSLPLVVANTTSIIRHIVEQKLTF